MLDQVSGKEHTRLHALFLDIFDYLVPIHALLEVRRKPNQLGSECSQATGRIYASSVPASPAFRRAKLCFLRSTKDGNFSSCAQPIDACRSVAFKLYPKWEVYIFMVVAKRQLTILAVKSVTAEVIAAGRADTVPSPVAEGTDNLV